MGPEAKGEGVLVASAKGHAVLEPGVNYHVTMRYDGEFFHVVANGQEIITMQSAVGTTPFGNVGVKVKNTSMALRQMTIY